MNSNDYVPCKVLSNISIAIIIACHSIITLYKVCESYYLSIPNIFDSCICDLDLPFLSNFLASYNLFQSAWFVLVCMATLDGDESDLPNKVCDIINCITINYITKKGCERQCLPLKGKVLSPDFMESEDAESFE